MLKEVEAALNFWFGTNKEEEEQRKVQWWKKDSNFDQLIKEKFEPLLIKAKAGELADWLDQAESCLAFIIVTDQFSRNIYRNQAASFAQDSLAISAAKQAIEKNFDHHLSLDQRWFLYMPFMHSEKLEEQEEALKLFKKLTNDAPDNLKEKFLNTEDFAWRHYVIVKRFNRFPHRNQILNRESTEEEIEFLKTPGSSF